MSAYHKKLEKPLSKEGSRVIICCKNNYLEGADPCRLAPFNSQETPQQRSQRCCGNYYRNSNYESSNKRYLCTGYDYNAKRCTKGSMPPPRKRFSDCKEKLQICHAL